MAQKVLRLIDIEETGTLVTKRRYTWHPGSIQPFSSLWITVMRFAMLNRPCFDSLNEDLLGRKMFTTAERVDLHYGRPTLSEYGVNISHFASIIGESLDAFQWSTIDCFPAGCRRLFQPSTKVCPTCIAQGFHTVIFSANCIGCCPCHGDKLWDVCPRCNRYLATTMKRFWGFFPNMCRCNYFWLDAKTARNPQPNSERDLAMTDVVNWIKKASERFWMRIPKRMSDSSELPADTLHDHIARWRDELGDDTPPWLDLNVQTRKIDNSRIRQIENSGIKLLSFSQVSGAGSSYIAQEPHPNWPVESSLEVFRIFKSIRRYLFKHVLGNRVHLIVWMGKNSSALAFRNYLKGNPYALAAWAILTWMQSSNWERLSAREWFLKLQGLPTYYPRLEYDPTARWGGRLQDSTVVNSSNESERWVMNWANASSILNIWPTQQDLDLCCTDEGFIQASWRRARCQPVKWWAWLGDDGRLRFGVYRRRPLWWVPATRRESKAERRWTLTIDSIRRIRTLRENMSAPTLHHLGDGTWQYEEARSFPPDADLRSSRLVVGAGRTSRFGVGIDPSATADSPTPWLVKSLDYPVCVTASTIKSGISNLKSAVQMYINTVGSRDAP